MKLDIVDCTILQSLHAIDRFIMYNDLTLSRMPQIIQMVVRPQKDLELPWSAGYQLYSGILNIMRQCDEATARYTHDSPLSSISISTLEGKFRRSQRPKHKIADQANRCNFQIGITDPKEAEIFRAIIQPLILREQDIMLDKGALRVEEIASCMESFEEILAKAGMQESAHVELDFLSITCNFLE